MKIKELRGIIREAIADRIKIIDEAGNIAAVQAKLQKVDSDIQDAMSVKQSISAMEGLRHYVSPEILGDLMGEMEESISELQGKKKEFEEQLKEIEKGSKPAKTKPSKPTDKKEAPEKKAPKK